jgi:phenylacetate-coenzyme A ligase PaaK-like adenylate-forming protein
MDPAFHKAIFNIPDQKTFREITLKVFLYQARHTPVYGEYLKKLKIDPMQINNVEEIPFLPVEFFKTHRVMNAGKTAETLFQSSGTTAQIPAQHSIADVSLYQESFTRGFTRFYGAPENFCIVALLPSYLQRSGSSLVYMMDHLIGLSQHPESGFYLNNLEALSLLLKRRNADRQPTLLVGVSFALLDLAERYPVKLKDHIILMETGGMKGRRKEMVREELHEVLRKAFGLETIHSEYGMTELLSQAYSSGSGLFHTPSWMKVLVRDPNDPFSWVRTGKTGGLNIIDLANLYSCSFLATGDLGRVHPDGAFEILGRFDHSDIRGCNLMVP